MKRFLIGQYANVYGDVISHVNITSVRVEDGGEFECLFENRAGKARHAARLNIYGTFLLYSLLTHDNYLHHIIMIYMDKKT
ncbi:Down syndrome cell adhesion molecule-like protein Dscam2 [Orchesella cincta]|uniref:Down syndrome cell adhesion molecule-like protein Dscam2 n=1 Tax=Orchesella cincta TaxID=48709 RepID=A0A1D2N9Z3_ORCCI|nr:Down syndrome cell adhesion molecule-like protein Dscam2 [Orchesella cincta]